MAEPAKQVTDPRERFLLLLVRYFDSALNDAELAEFNVLLRTDPECRQQFAEHGTNISLIRETLSLERQAATVFPSDPIFHRPKTTQPTAPSRMAVRRRVLFIAGAAALLIIVILAIWGPFRQQQEAPAIATAEPSSGEVRVITPGGEVRVVTEAVQLRSGDTVRTEDLRGAATIIYADGTRIMLVGETAVTCSDHQQKSLVVHQGTVALSVRPQPEGRPMMVATSAARIEVLGTEFSCQANRDRTDVSVTQGSVRVVRVSDGRTVEVTKGKRLLTESGAEFAVESIPILPDTWNLDFEQGPPADLHRGRFVMDGLPTGSKGGVAAVRADHGAEGVFYEIASPEAWYRGLFAVHADTHLHITYKMGPTPWINSFIITRGPDPNGSYAGNYKFTALRPASRWCTATIPLSEFRRAGRGEGLSSSKDEVPYLLLFSSPDEHGLVIDRMWITRRGPGVVQFEDVE